MNSTETGPKSSATYIGELPAVQLIGCYTDIYVPASQADSIAKEYKGYFDKECVQEPVGDRHFVQVIGRWLLGEWFEPLKSFHQFLAFSNEQAARREVDRTCYVKELA
jgi:hypothetical protein